MFLCFRKIIFLVLLLGELILYPNSFIYNTKKNRYESPRNDDHFEIRDCSDSELVHINDMIILSNFRNSIQGLSRGAKICANITNKARHIILIHYVYS